MGRDQSSSRAVVIERDPQPREVPSSARSVAGAIGLAEKGPIEQAVYCVSFADYAATFGGFTTSSDLALAVKGYFENGGRQIWVSRVLSPGAISAAGDLLAEVPSDPSPASMTGTLAAPFALEDGDTLAVHTTAALRTLLFSGAAAASFDQSGSPRVQPYPLEDGVTLIVAIDGGPPQTITFTSDQFANIGAATALEIVAAINAQITGAQASPLSTGAFAITSLTRGTASQVEILGGTGAGPATGPSLSGTLPLPVMFQNGDELHIEANGHSYTITFLGTPAVVQDLSASPKVEPFVLSDGMTMTLTVDWGPVQTVTFSSDQFADIGAATTAEVAAAIEAQVTGIEASATPAGGLRLATIRKGNLAQMQPTGGTAIAGPAVPASVVGTAPLPVSLHDGDQLHIDTNGTSNTITFHGTPAVLQDNSGTPKVEPFQLSHGMTMTVIVNFGAAQTVTFSSGQFANIGAATAAEVAAAIEAQLAGVHASVTPAGGIRLETIRKGTQSQMQATGGTALSGSALPASVVGTVLPPVALQDGDQLSIEANGNLYTVTFHGAPAVLRDTSVPKKVEPFALSNGMTLTLAVDGGGAQTVTFSSGQFANIASATAAEVANVINAQATGVHANAVSGAVEITTLSKGSSSRIVPGGTAASALGLNDESPVGTGNVPNLNAVTSSNITNLASSSGASGQVDIHAVASGLSFATWSPGSSATLRVTGAAAVALGVDSALHKGADSDRFGIAFQYVTGGGNVPDLAAVTAQDVEACVSSTGASGQVDVDQVGTGITFITRAAGATVTLQVTGSVATALGIDALIHKGLDGDRFGIAYQFITGTGNVPDLNAVTADDIMSCIWTSGAGADVGVQDVGGRIVFAVWPWYTGSSVNLQVSGPAAEALGVDPTEHAGLAEDIFGLRSETSTGTGSVPNLAAVTVADVAAVASSSGADDVVQVTSVGGFLRLTSVASGPSATLRVSGPAATPLGFDLGVHTGTAGPPIPFVGVRIASIERGSYGNRLSVVVSSVPPDRFDLAVYEDTTQKERFENLSRLASDPRFVESIVNDPVTGSEYVRATCTSEAVDEPLRPQTLPLTGGDDGLDAAPDALFIGDELAATGLHALDAVQDLSILLVPGRATPAVHAAMLSYCEEHRDGSVFAVLDAPAGVSAEAMVTYVTATASLEGSSDYGAIYWPRVRILNPKKSVFGPARDITTPPSGIIAGVYARTEGSGPGGVYEAPAGVEIGRMFGVVGLETDDALKARKRDLVYPHRINPLTAAPGRGPYIDGSRTLDGEGISPFVGVRRGIQHIEQSLMRQLEPLRYRSNTPDLRAQVRRNITAFLLNEMNNGAFQSRDPATAFYVDVSDALNPPSVVAAGKLVVRVGLAMNRPGELVVLEISQDTRALDGELG